MAPFASPPARLSNRLGSPNPFRHLFPRCHPSGGRRIYRWCYLVSQFVPRDAGWYFSLPSKRKRKTCKHHLTHDRRPYSTPMGRPSISSQMRGQLLSHILAYAEMLLTWQLHDKRVELLKLVKDEIQDLSLDSRIADATLSVTPIGMLRSTPRAGISYTFCLRL